MPSLVDLAMAVDPVYLAHCAGFQCDSWQSQFLRSPASRQLLCASRQSGKSTVCAIKAVHTALFTPGSLVMLLSPTLRQSSEALKRCADIYHSLDCPPASPTSESALSIKLDNGSRILSLPGAEATVRGYTPDLLIVDEAARVDDALYLSIRPGLAVSQGKLVLLSTPFGTRGFFYQEWLQRQRWEYFEVKATDCQRISPEFLEEERVVLGEWWWRQEYMVEFLDSEGAAFRSEDIDKIISEEVEVWNL